MTRMVHYFGRLITSFHRSQNTTISILKWTKVYLSFATLFIFTESFVGRKREKSREREGRRKEVARNQDIDFLLSS